MFISIARLLLFACTAYAYALPDPLLTIRQSTPDCPDQCSGAAIKPVNTTLYLCGDPRLGPNILPTQFSYGYSVANVLNPYSRFGGLCPNEFLQKWTNPSGSFTYPPLNGYQLDINGVPIQGNIMLPVGKMVDRFGSEYGTFLGPLEAPYIQRALPPSNLDTDPNNNTYPYNYHVYNVTVSFLALSGPIAPWFGQPGGGVQYQTSVSIMTLVNGGYLTRLLDVNGTSG